MNKIESFITNMQWKALFLLTNNFQNKSQDIMVLKLITPRPYIKELDNFEAELIGLVWLIKYRRISNNV